MNRLAARELKASYLCDRGFKALSRWLITDKSIRLETPVPDEPAVYAFSVDGNVHYVGVARSLRTRMVNYQRPGASQKTSKRVGALIREALESGKGVDILAAKPPNSEWNGLPVECIAGLEIGLIHRFKPAWNMVGTGLRYAELDDL